MEKRLKHLWLFECYSLFQGFVITHWLTDLILVCNCKLRNIWNNLHINLQCIHACTKSPAVLSGIKDYLFLQSCQGIASLFRSIWMHLCTYALMHLSSAQFTTVYFWVNRIFCVDNTLIIIWECIGWYGKSWTTLASRI